MNKRTGGFTLIELIITIGIIAILAAAVIIAVNPSRQFAQARNSQRRSDIRAILDAVYQYASDHKGSFPVGLDSNLKVIGTSQQNCQMLCGASEGGASEQDNSKQKFDLGVYFNTQWDAVNNWLELTAAGQASGSGTYTSNSKDSISDSIWQTIRWTPSRPFYKELPNNQASESGYPAGNANMSGNALLLHFNESVGAMSFSDASGNANNGFCSGANCPVISSSGRFNNDLNFDGANDFVAVNSSASLNPTAAIALEAWVRWNIPPNTGNSMAVIVNKNRDSQYQIRHNAGNTRFQFVLRTNAGTTGTAQSTTAPQQGRWYHLAGTWDNNSQRMLFYVNGVLERNILRTGANIVSSASVLNIGRRSLSNDRYFNGLIDEVAIYNRVLSASEALDHYKRGALRLRAQVRTCDDAVCNGESFIGPDGTAGSYYSELSNTSLNPPAFNLSSLSSLRYFQYRFFSETDRNTLSPEVKEVTINFQPMKAVTDPSCIDLSPVLVSQYLSLMPQDPKDGSEGMSGYAIQKSSAGRIKIAACSSEVDQEINIQR